MIKFTKPSVSAFTKLTREQLVHGDTVTIVDTCGEVSFSNLYVVARMPRGGELGLVRLDMDANIASITNVRGDACFVKVDVNLSIAQ